jgi:hypothetical protein
MNKETLRMQMLAGIITESQYKEKLNEGVYSVISNEDGEILVSGNSESEMYSQLVNMINQDPKSWDLKITKGGMLLDPLNQNEVISRNAKQWIMDKLKGEGIGGTWVLKNTKLNENKINNKYVVKDEELSDEDGDFYVIDQQKAYGYLSQFNGDDVDAGNFISEDEGWGEFEQYIDNVEQMTDKELEDAMREEMSMYFFSNPDELN